MNKRDAKKYALRFISGLVNQQCYGKGPIPRDPYVYDCFCDNEIAGKRMSKEDRLLVDEEIEELGMNLYEKGRLYNGSESNLILLMKCKSKAKGKVGKKFPGYKDMRRRQGYNKP